jgi:hypothetical protein
MEKAQGKRFWRWARIVRKSLKTKNQSGDEQNLELSERESCYRKTCRHKQQQAEASEIYRG